jgi:hypothetical protein
MGQSVTTMSRFTILATIFFGLFATTSYAQTTQTGSVSAGATKYYRLTPSNSGQFTATVSWDNSQSTVFLLIVCGTNDPQAFGVGAGGLDRLAQFESGLIGLTPCLLGVSTTSSSPSTSYRLTLQMSSPQAAVAQSLRAVGDVGEVDARLIEQTDRLIGIVRSGLR